MFDRVNHCQSHSKNTCIHYTCNPNVSCLRIHRRRRQYMRERGAIQHVNITAKRTHAKSHTHTHTYSLQVALPHLTTHRVQEEKRTNQIYNNNNNKKRKVKEPLTVHCNRPRHTEQAHHTAAIHDTIWRVVRGICGIYMW